jgi:hypothetical protein
LSSASDRSSGTTQTSTTSVTRPNLAARCARRIWSIHVGLSAAILLDATIVRAMLVPATMKLLGDWNWYLPDRLRKALRLKPRSGSVAQPEAGG